MNFDYENPFDWVFIVVSYAVITIILMFTLPIWVLPYIVIKILED